MLTKREKVRDCGVEWLMVRWGGSYDEERREREGGNRERVGEEEGEEEKEEEEEDEAEGPSMRLEDMCRRNWNVKYRKSWKVDDEEEDESARQSVLVFNTSLKCSDMLYPIISPYRVRTYLIPSVSPDPVKP